MSKTTLKQYVPSLGDALKTFDIKVLKKWMKNNNPALFQSFKKASELVQMASMCKMICNRTDLLGTEAHKKATEWLKEHNMKGEIF